MPSEQSAHPQVRDQALLHGHHLIAQTCLGHHPLWFTTSKLESFRAPFVQYTVYIGLIQSRARMFVLPSLFVANPTPQPKTECIGTDSFAHTAAVVGGLWSNLCSLNTSIAIGLSKLSFCPCQSLRMLAMLFLRLAGIVGAIFSVASPMWNEAPNETTPHLLTGYRSSQNPRLVILPSKN